MRPLRALVWIGCLAIVSSVSVASEPPPNGVAPPLDALVTEARERSPVIAAARATVAAQREMEGPAGALPDPMIETTLQNVGFDSTVGREDMSMIGLEARQRLPFPGKRAATRALAEAETAAASVDLTAIERQVEAEVGTLYARIYGIDREGESLGAAAELVELLEEVAHVRLAAGEGGQEAVLKTQLQRLRLAERRSDLAAERHSAVAELNRWLDRPGDAPFGVVETLPPPSAVPWVAAEAEALALEGSLEVARAVAAYRLAERRVQLARLHLKPDFSAGAGLASRAGLDPVVSLRFGVEVPLWRRQKHHPMIHAAAHELAAAADEIAGAQAQVRAEAARLRSTWLTAEEQVTRYREGILPLTGETLDAARSAYLAGRGSFSTVIEDFELWLEARVSLARREAEGFAARLAFHRLAGAVME